MNSAQTRKVIAAGMIGNVLEWYDFAIYGYFASAIGRQFFPHENPVAQLLSAFGVFALGYLMRPVGGALIGHIGDRFGRRGALTFSVTAMAIPTFLIGVLPGYSTLGLLAPAALTLLRMVQGLSVGGATSQKIWDWDVGRYASETSVTSNLIGFRRTIDKSTIRPRGPSWSAFDDPTAWKLDALRHMQACVQRVLKDRAWERARHRDGTLSGFDLPEIVRAFLFATGVQASESARFANGDWRDINIVRPIIDPFVRAVGDIPHVMSSFLTLCENV
jgi:hypothetical protein